MFPGVSTWSFPDAASGPSAILSFLGGLPAGVVALRASTGTYFNGSGVRVTAGTNEARLDHNPATLQPRGLLIEGARTNLLLNSSSPVTQNVNVSTTTYTLWVDGAGSATVAAGTAIGSGFGVATAGNPVVFTISSAGTVSVTVSGALSTFQLEAGGFASSYIPTGGATVTRASDFASTLLSAIGFNPDEGTVLVEFELFSTSGNRAVVFIHDGTNTSTLSHGVFSGDNSWAVRVSSVVTANLTFMPASTSGSIIKQIGTYKTDDVRAARNGTLATPDTSAVLPTGLTTLQLGSRNSDQHLFGWIRKVTYYPYPLSDAQLQALTA